MPGIEDILVPGAGIISNAINVAAQAGTNKRNRKFTREMYWRQREDSLSDWEMQNAYNSPAAQMERLKAAGLNPNLVYGTGAATSNAAPVRQSSSSGGQGQAPSVDLQTPVMGMYDMRIKNAQADNLQQQKKLLELEGIVKLVNIENKRADTEKKLTETHRGKFELNLRQSNAEALSGIIQQTLEKMKADTQFTLNQDERNTAMTASNLVEAAHRVLNMQAGRAKTEQEVAEIRARIKNIDTDTELKKADLILRQKGIYPGDPVWMRALIQWLETGAVGDSLKGLNPFGPGQPGQYPNQDTKDSMMNRYRQERQRSKDSLYNKYR